MGTYQLLDDALALVIHDTTSIPIRVVRPDKSHVAVTPITQLGVPVT